MYVNIDFEKILFEKILMNAMKLNEQWFCIITVTAIDE